MWELRPATSIPRNRTRRHRTGIFTMLAQASLMARSSDCEGNGLRVLFGCR